MQASYTSLDRGHEATHRGEARDSLNPTCCIIDVLTGEEFFSNSSV